MKKQFILTTIAFVLVTGFIVFQSDVINVVTAANPNPIGTIENVSFQNDVQPIFERRCTKCHGGDFPSKGLNVESYESLMAGSQNGPVIIPDDASHSLLIQKVTAGEMPKRGPKLTSDQIQILRNWINNGALNN